jgi:hypothetical protein
MEVVVLVVLLTCVMTCCTCSQELDLSNHPKISDDGVLQLLDYVTTLHTLNVHGCPLVTADGIHQLTEDRRHNFPYIEERSHSTPGV